MDIRLPALGNSGRFGDSAWGRRSAPSEAAIFFREKYSIVDCRSAIILREAATVIPMWVTTPVMRINYSVAVWQKYTGFLKCHMKAT